MVDRGEGCRGHERIRFVQRLIDSNEEKRRALKGPRTEELVRGERKEGRGERLEGREGREEGREGRERGGLTAGLGWAGLGWAGCGVLGDSGEESQDSEVSQS